MNKSNIFTFCKDVIENDAKMKKLANDPILFVTLTLVASTCVEAFQKALMEGVEFEAANITTED